MHIKRRATNSDGSKVENRRSHRFNVSVPVEVSWRGADDKAIKEPATAKIVNHRGGYIEMAAYPELGNRVTITNFLSAEAVEARVLATPNSRAGVSQGIIVEFVVPNERFWGVDLQVKKTAVELQKLEAALRAEGIDLRLLKEFRDAVDYIRTAAAVSQQLRERQLQGKEEDDVLCTMAAERMRRATNLLLAVVTDLDAAHITRETEGAEELLTSMEQTCARLKDLLKLHAPARPPQTRQDQSRQEQIRPAVTRY